MAPKIVVLVPTESGRSIPVEVDSSGPDDLSLAASGGDRWPELTKTIEASIGLIAPVLDAVGATLGQLESAPSKASAKLSLSVAGEVGFAIAKGSSEGAIEITCEWEPPSTNETQEDAR